MSFYSISNHGEKQKHLGKKTAFHSFNRFYSKRCRKWSYLGKKNGTFDIIYQTAPMARVTSVSAARSSTTLLGSPRPPKVSGGTQILFPGNFWVLFGGTLYFFWRGVGGAEEGCGAPSGTHTGHSSHQCSLASPTRQNSNTKEFPSN